MFGNKEWSKWTTEILVNGPIKVDNNISFLSRKDVEYAGRLMSNIKIANYQNGVKLEVDSYAHQLKFAKEAAYLFSGLALDVLSLKLNLPLYVDLYEQKNKVNYDNEGVKRSISQDELRQSFEESRLLTFTEPTFLRAVGWFRKGKLTQDPSDKFLAFWNAIEVVAAKYHTKTDKTKKGTKNQINQCFRDLWGEPKDWKIVPDENWIDENSQTRTEVAHGLINIDVKSINEIRSKINIIEELAYQFLNEWRRDKLKPEEKVNDENRSKIYDENWIKIE
ncbi:MAG: hypothetical protein IPG55_16405 [Saprospiraceae bacterium]|nr:hypothetical protein [Candidatus Defluviibacterium haderslevense]